MALPHLLLVDDSEAILAYEKAALGSHYEISTACDGEEALGKALQIRPALIVLDLSMPKLDGEAVLQAVVSDPTLRDTSVVVVSAERDRALACFDQGASEVLIKPVRATELLAVVNRVLQEAETKRRNRGLAAVLVEAGGHTLAIPAELVRGALLQPALCALPLGPSYLSQLLEYQGEAICVLDLAVRLGREHTRPPEDRKLLLLRVHDKSLALCVDDIHHPEVFAATATTRSEGSAAQSDPVLRRALVALVTTEGGAAVPVIDPMALMSRRLTLRLDGRFANRDAEPQEQPR